MNITQVDKKMGRVRISALTLESILKELRYRPEMVEVCQALCIVLNQLNERLTYEIDGPLGDWWNDVEEWN